MGVLSAGLFVLLFAGMTSALTQRSIDTVLASEDLPTLHLITVETEDTTTLAYLNATAERFGWPLTVLGHNTSFEGRGTKTFEMYKYLKTLPHRDVAVLIDGRDVLVNGSPEDFWANFSVMHKDKVIISAEAQCCPHGEPYVTNAAAEWMYSEAKAKNRLMTPFLNMGMAAGKVSALLQFYPFGMVNLTHIDQNAASLYWHAHPHLAQLDYDEKLFANILPSKKPLDDHTYQWSEEGTKWRSHAVNATLGVYPIFIQAPKKYHYSALAEKSCPELVYLALPSPSPQPDPEDLDGILASPSPSPSPDPFETLELPEYTYPAPPIH